MHFIVTKSKALALKDRTVLDANDNGSPPQSILCIPTIELSGVVRYMSLISALCRQRQADLGEFEVSLVYKVSSRITRAM